MIRNVRSDWIAQAEARFFEEAASMQHGTAEPKIVMVIAEPGAAPRHWVRRLLARLPDTSCETGRRGRNFRAVGWLTRRSR